VKRCATLAAAALATSLAGLAHAQAGAVGVPPPDQVIRQILAGRVEALAGPEDGIGIVVGVVGPWGRRTIAYGHFDRGDPRALDGNTVFEIGSVGKVFTALLLADMVERGEVTLADPASKYLPRTRIPGWKGRSITLVDLATHTSGLPFMPDELPRLDEATATFGPPQLEAFLARCKLQSEIGSSWEYSNVGYWLLGQALASRAGKPYAELLQARVLRPLKLESTGFTVSRELKAKTAVGHDAVLHPSPPASEVPLLAAMPASGGGLVSSANDMLTFLSAALGYGRSPFSAAMATLLATRRPLQPGTEQALGWVVTGGDAAPLIIHDGGTLGYSSAVAWDPRTRVGVVVLSNQLAGVGDIARHLLRPAMPLESPKATRRTEITLDARVLDTYVGQYEAKDEGAFIVAREGSLLTIQAPAAWGLPKLRLRPESLREFFTSELPLRVVFQVDDAGHVTGVLVHPPRGQGAVQTSRINPDR
jgi:D-alanyl-D-alanine-carboxypeptidase/D-alanyl-D-alanine-endopeptidase